MQSEGSPSGQEEATDLLGIAHQAMEVKEVVVILKADGEVGEEETTGITVPTMATGRPSSPVVSLQ